MSKQFFKRAFVAAALMLGVSRPSNSTPSEFQPYLVHTTFVTWSFSRYTQAFEPTFVLLADRPDDFDDVDAEPPMHVIVVRGRDIRTYHGQLTGMMSDGSRGEVVFPGGEISFETRNGNGRPVTRGQWKRLAEGRVYELQDYLNPALTLAALGLDRRMYVADVDGPERCANDLVKR